MAPIMPSCGLEWFAGRRPGWLLKNRSIFDLTIERCLNSESVHATVQTKTTLRDTNASMLLMEVMGGNTGNVIWSGAVQESAVQQSVQHQRAPIPKPSGLQRKAKTGEQPFPQNPHESNADLCNACRTLHVPKSRRAQV